MRRKNDFERGDKKTWKSIKQNLHVRISVGAKSKRGLVARLLLFMCMKVFEIALICFHVSYTTLVLSTPIPALSADHTRTCRKLKKVVQRSA